MVRPLALVLVAALVSTSCSDAPTGAPLLSGSPSLATGATVEKGEGVFVSRATFFLGCVGERITENTRIPFRYHLVVAPNGNTHYSEMYIPGAATGTFVGLTTGTVWTLEDVTSPFVSNVNGSGEIMFFTANVRWRSEDGRLMRLQPNYHFRTNPDGEVVLEFNNGHCTVT
jgi:hypothetical protein